MKYRGGSLQSFWNSILRWKFSLQSWLQKVQWSVAMKGIRLHPELTENICKFAYRHVWELCKKYCLWRKPFSSQQTKPTHMKETECKIQAYYFWLFFSFGSLYRSCVLVLYNYCNHFPSFQLSESKLSWDRVTEVLIQLHSTIWGCIVKDFVSVSPCC